MFASRANERPCPIHNSRIRASAFRAAKTVGRPIKSALTLRMFVVAAFALAVAVVLAHRPWSQPEGGDKASWDYVAQSIVRGRAPYRDVVEIKSLLSAYLSAAAIVIGGPAGLQDVMAVRMLNVLMVGALSALTFLIGATFFAIRSPPVSRF